MTLIPAERLLTWEVGVDVGVPSSMRAKGGLDGGIPTRTTIVNVTDYNVSGSNTSTTGAISNGSIFLSVSSASTFEIGHGLRAGYPAIHELEITSGPSADDNARFLLAGKVYFVFLTSGDTPTQVATKIRAAEFGDWVLSGTGTKVRFTSAFPGARSGVSVYAAIGTTGISTVIQAGTLVADTTIANVAGNTITLSSPASGAITNGLVVHSDSSAIHLVVAGASPEDVIYFPAGTYNFFSRIVINTSNRTLRGAGMDQTTFKLVDTASFALIGNGGSEFSTSIVSGISQGSTSITVADATGFSANHLMKVSFENDTSIPVVSMFGYDYDNGVLGGNGLRRQQVKITNVTGNVITFTPGLYDSYGGGALAGNIYSNATFVTGLGLEDFTIDCSESTAGDAFQMYNSHGNWIKNVKASLASGHMFTFASCCQCEVRGCYIDRQGSGSNSSGMGFFTVSGFLVEDNIVHRAFPGFEVNGGSSGNVFAYNYIDETYHGIDSNHDPHNSYNLYEGNDITEFICDGYSGGASRDTVFRNVMTAWGNDGALRLKRFTREYSVVGNIFYPGVLSTHGLEVRLGEPNIGNDYNHAGTEAEGTAQLSMGDPWAEFSYLTENRPGTLSYDGTTTVTATNSVFNSTTHFGRGINGANWYILITSGARSGQYLHLNSYTSGLVAEVDDYGWAPFSGVTFRIVPSGGDLGLQELDLDVEATLVRKGNRYTVDNSVESLGGDPLPDSLFRSSSPSYFGSLNWPPYNPSVSWTEAASSAELIPAGYRFINGNEDYLGGVSSPQFSPPAGTYGSSQSVSITSSTPGATIRYTTDGSTPTNSYGTIYSSPLSVASTTTIKAIAYNGVLDDSSVTSATYTIGSTVASPSFSPVAGSYGGTQSVAISTITSGATIRYTTDGSTPSASSGIIYSSPIGVAETMTIKAIAYKSGLFDSAVVSAAYTITTPPGGSASAGNLTATVFNLAG